MAYFLNCPLFLHIVNIFITTFSIINNYHLFLLFARASKSKIKTLKNQGLQLPVDKFDSGLSGVQLPKMIVSGHRKRGEALRNGGFEK